MSEIVKEVLRDWIIQTLGNISEEHYAASWVEGIGSEVLRAIHRLPSPTYWGMQQFDVETLRKLRSVSELLGEWPTTTGFEKMVWPEEVEAS